VINHEKVLAVIPKAISQIADSLPRVELASILYPTEGMKTAISDLYAHILRFLIRARDWYEEGTLRRWLHSITRPAELRYNDLLEQIAQSSRLIDQLAAYGSQAEIRNINNKLDMVLTELDRSNSIVKDLRTSFTCMLRTPESLYLLSNSSSLSVVVKYVLGHQPTPHGPAICANYVGPLSSCPRRSYQNASVSPISSTPALYDHHTIYVQPFLAIAKTAAMVRFSELIYIDYQGKLFISIHTEGFLC